MADELKPCPACGGVAEMKRQGNDYTKKRRIVVNTGGFVAVELYRETCRERDELRRMLDAVLALEEPVERALIAEVDALKAKVEAVATYGRECAEAARTTLPMSPGERDVFLQVSEGLDAILNDAREGGEG